MESSACLPLPVYQKSFAALQLDAEVTHKNGRTQVMSNFSETVHSLILSSSAESQFIKLHS
jgi:hypothetical protein